MDVTQMVCRYCGESGRLHRAHSRNWLERAAKPLLPVRRFVCHTCGSPQVRWVGFFSRRRRRQHPLWLILVLTPVAVMAGSNVAAG